MAKKPLVLDVDGTLLRSDLLFECFWAGLGRDPLRTLRTSLRHLSDPAKLKSELADIAELRTDLVPVNKDVSAIARDASDQGREVVLASASDRRLVEQITQDLGYSDKIFASHSGQNLKGMRKADALVAAYGEGGFDYVGNAIVDRAIWNVADEAIVVGDPRSAQALRARGKRVTEIASRWRARDLLRALRPHQWVKNILLLVPLIAGHAFDPQTLMLALLGMISFSAAASAIYLVNDLLDLEADRLHETKRHRPFAAGDVPISIGMASFLLLAVVALGTAAVFNWAFLGVVAFYMLMSLAYSLKLKRLRWVDIATLASLYSLRVVAGAAATGIYVSGYLLVFIFPVFLALGCVKRLTELSLATTEDRLPGRGYARTDRPDLLNMAALGVVAALIAFFLYSFTDQAIGLYKTQWLIWVAELPIAMWLIRMVRLGWHGKQDHDPIIFALKDKRGLGLIMISISIMFYAAGLWQHWFGLN